MTDEHGQSRETRGRRGPGPRVHGGHGHRGHGRGFGRSGGWQQADLPPVEDVAEWFRGRLPEQWFTGVPRITVDREEILVLGELAAPDHATGSAAAGRIARFREETRPERMAIATEAGHRYGRKVSWGAQLGGESVLFTHLAVPVMTRLRQPERQVLDTLVDAGVARSRSEALAWTVKLAGQHSEKWLAELRDAMEAVDRLRSQGPNAREQTGQPDGAEYPVQE